MRWLDERAPRKYFVFSKHMSLDLVHQLKGKHIVYVLELQPGEDNKRRRYVGSTTNVERRTAEHLGVKSGGAAWCKKYKPIDVISVRIVDSKEEAAAMEVMLCAIHMAECGINQCRGGRWNMSGDMKKRPPYFEDIEFQSPRSEDAPQESDIVMETPAITLPDILPPNYDVLRDENGVTEEQPPKSCPCFRDERDPDGRLRHLAGLILY